jgi:hypothetical protein
MTRMTLRPAFLVACLSLACLAAPALGAPGRAGVASLKAGCYRADVKQTARANADGTTVDDALKLTIMVTGIDASGGVDAQVTLLRESGLVTGSVDAKGVLRLVGDPETPALPGDRRFELTAAVGKFPRRRELRQEERQAQTSKRKFREKRSTRSSKGSQREQLALFVSLGRP